MKLDWEKFQAAYQNSPPELQALIDGEEIPAHVGAIIYKHQLNIPKSLLVVCALNKTLGLETDAAIAEFLKSYNLSELESSQIISELAESNPDLDTSTVSGGPVYSREEMSPKSITIPINNPGWRQIATEPTPVALEPAPAIPPLRTMAGDSNRQIGYQSLDEETHSSTQDSLLENRH